MKFESVGTGNEPENAELKAGRRQEVADYYSERVQEVVAELLKSLFDQQLVANEKEKEAKNTLKSGLSGLENKLVYLESEKNEFKAANEDTSAELKTIKAQIQRGKGSYWDQYMKPVIDAKDKEIARLESDCDEYRLDAQNARSDLQKLNHETSREIKRTEDEKKNLEKDRDSLADDIRVLRARERENKEKVETRSGSSSCKTLRHPP